MGSKRTPSELVGPPPEVAFGIHRITTPLPFRPREVHAYLIEAVPGEWVLVDGGINTDDAWHALDAGVRAVAGNWDRVRAHVVTHMHMDHIGLARRVREASGAPLRMGRLDAERAAHANAHPDEEAAYRERLLRENGAPEAVLQALQQGRRETHALSEPVPADALPDGEAAALPGVPGWEFVWTPGHTAGHITLFRPGDGVLIAGDAVLPRITPTIGVNRQREDPVGDYLGTLARLAALDVRQVLPGHGEPITEPAARIAALREATEREADEVAALLGDGPRPAWEVAAARYAGRDLPVSMRVQALRETLAHLQHLREMGRANSRAIEGGVVGWSCR